MTNHWITMHQHSPIVKSPTQRFLKNGVLPTQQTHGAPARRSPPSQDLDLGGFSVFLFWWILLKNSPVQWWFIMSSVCFPESHRFTTRKMDTLNPYSSMMYRRSHPFWAALAMFDCRRPNKIWSSVDETFRAAFLVTSLLLTLIPQVEEVDISDYSIHSVLRIQIKTLKSSGSPADSHGCSSTAKNKYLWDALQFSPGSKWLTPVRWLVQQGWCTLIAASRRTRSTKCSA